MTDTLTTYLSQPNFSDVGMVHYLLVALGALLYNLMELDKIRKSKVKFDFKFWLADNYLRIIITSISLVTMFLLKEDLKDIMGFDMSNKVGCFLAGFTVHTFVNKAKDISDKEIKKNSDGNNN